MTSPNGLFFVGYRRMPRAMRPFLLWVSVALMAAAGLLAYWLVRLLAFPEFAHAAPVYPTLAELQEKLAVPVPNEHTDRLQAKAKEHGIYIQTGTMIEADPRWPGVVFNTTCLLGPEGLLYKYRKVNPWIPYEVHASPHEVPGYDEPLFPVADTEIGRIGCATRASNWANTLSVSCHSLMAYFCSTAGTIMIHSAEACQLVR